MQFALAAQEAEQKQRFSPSKLFEECEIHEYYRRALGSRLVRVCLFIPGLVGRFLLANDLVGPVGQKDLDHDRRTIPAQGVTDACLIHSRPKWSSPSLGNFNVHNVA